MKTFLKTTMYVSIFVLSGIIFQISCSNSESDAVALNPTLNGKLIYLKQLTGAPIELWTCDYDGANQAQIPITLPTDVQFSSINNNRSSVKLSPDGQKVFFIGFNTVTNISSIYSCDFSGSNLQEIMAAPSATTIELGGIN